MAHVKRFFLVKLSLLMLIAPGIAQQSLPAVGVPAQAGDVIGTGQNSDQFTWTLLTYFAAPVPNTFPSKVLFETWATDGDIYTVPPHWPDANEPKKFDRRKIDNLGNSHQATISVPCNPPPNAAVGGFPTSGTPTPCIAEMVSRNRPEYDYIVGNGLNTQPGLANAYANGFVVSFPKPSIAVKTDWVPAATILQWIPQLNTIEAVRSNYYTAYSEGTEYALVSIHVASKQNPEWVWGSFENQFNPGRCDTMGCYDSFGAQQPVVLPNKEVPNTQYGSCAKTQQLGLMMVKAGLASVWQNYCLKSSMVDFVAKDGTPWILGNSVIERIQENGSISTQSCISCHSYASFGSNGETTASASAMLAFQPVGKTMAGPLKGSKLYDFMWGVLNAPSSSGSPSHR